MTLRSPHPPLMSRFTEELDVAIHNMETPATADHISGIVRRLPGVEASRLIPGGVWMRYRPEDTNEECLLQDLENHGIRATPLEASGSGSGWMMGAGF